MSKLKPLVAIVGTTGVGKSKLAVDLALHLNATSFSDDHPRRHYARIINGDAMQVYKGLDILTNKMSAEEQCGVPHHLLGFKAPGEQYLVTDWVRDATSCIEDAHRNNELPIVVGGTAYWIQNLIFASRLASFSTDNSKLSKQDDKGKWDPEILRRLELLPEELKHLWFNLPAVAPHPDQAPSESLRLHVLLDILDSVTAARWHWRDSRRVLTSLRVIKEHGKMVGDVQSNQDMFSRYRALIIWLYSNQNALRPRLDERVDVMLSCGLLDEIKELMAFTGGGKQDITNGIYQSIGYREFEGYLDSETPPGDLDEDKKLFKSAADRMKISTRQYARRQVQWLRNKLMPVVKTSDDTSMFIVKVEDSDKWDSGPKRCAISLMEDFLSSKPLEDQGFSDFPELELAPRTDINSRFKRICDVCTKDLQKPIMIEEGREWDLHIRTRRHRKGVRKQKQSMQCSPSGRSESGDGV